MCELLAASAAMPFPLARPLAGLRPMDAFRRRSRENPDGWGMALWDGPAVRLFKEPVSAEASGLYGLLARDESLRSPTWLVHVRETSVGGNTPANTHPFSREWKGRDYGFAHNGTLKNLPGLPQDTRFLPTGATDSEWAFCRLMHELVSRPQGTEDQSLLEGQGMADAFEACCHEVNALGKFNVLFSDGRMLWVYRDKAGYKGLCWRAMDGVALVASKPLSEGPWEELIPGALAVFQDGKRLR